MKFSILYIILLCIAISTTAQDIHFSNFYTNALNVNPAFTGFFKGKSRFSVSYRDQYRTVAVPFQTIAISYDTRPNNLFGYGMLVNYDIAGDSHFNTIQINIPIAQKYISQSKNWILSAGIMPGIFFNSLEYTYLRFPEQFDGTQYNPDIIPTENMEQANNGFFNVSVGMQATYKHNKKQSYTLGTGFYNITNPNMSFFNDKEVKLKTRTMLHGMAILRATPNLDAIPAFKIQYQGSQKEYHFGGMLLRYFDNTTIQNLSGGIWFRSREKDAVILGLGFTYLDYNFICNYDINISTLQVASNGHGALEFTVSNIMFQQKKKKRMTSIKCPPYL